MYYVALEKSIFVTELPVFPLLGPEIYLLWWLSLIKDCMMLFVSSIYPPDLWDNVRR